jgi:nicotinate-nucleotide adenylyltransferase
MRLGIFGGSFDPPHVGHLIVADDAVAALGLDRLLFVPTGNHPLKHARVEAPGDLRLEMVEAATAASEAFGELHRWQRVEEIAQRARIAVMSRADAPALEPKIDVDFDSVEVTHIAISSSDVRERVRAGKPFRYLVPAPVYDIIARRSLYRNQINEE